MGHILAIPRNSGLWDTPRIVKFGMEHPLAHWLRFRKNKFWRPCEDHVLAIKSHILTISRLWGYRIHPAMWDLAWKIKEVLILSTIKGNILAISRKRGLLNTLRVVKFGMKHPGAHWLWFRKYPFKGPYEDHVLAIKGHILAIFREGGNRIKPVMWTLA